MSGLNDGSNDRENGAGWEDIGLYQAGVDTSDTSIEGGELLSALEAGIAHTTEKVTGQVGVSTTHLWDQRSSPRIPQNVSRLAPYGENIPAHHQTLEQVFTMIEWENWDNEIIQKLLQEVIKTTEETKSYQATAEKALECLFWMEVRGCKNHTIYMEAVRVLKTFLPKAFDKKAIEAYDETIHWDVIKAATTKEIGDKARREGFNGNVSTDKQKAILKRAKEKIDNLKIDYTGLKWGFFKHQFSYEQLEALKNSGHFDENKMPLLQFPYTENVIWDSYIGKMRDAKWGIMDQIRTQMSEMEKLTAEAAWETLQ